MDPGIDTRFADSSIFILSSYPFTETCQIFGVWPWAEDNTLFLPEDTLFASTNVFTFSDVPLDMGQFNHLESSWLYEPFWVSVSIRSRVETHVYWHPEGSKRLVFSLDHGGELKKGLEYIRYGSLKCVEQVWLMT